MDEYVAIDWKQRAHEESEKCALYRELLCAMTGLSINASLHQHRFAAEQIKKRWRQIAALADRWDKIPYGRGSSISCARDLRKALGVSEGSTET
jgi:hypothetical protein